MRYGHIIDAVYGKPWAIRPEVLAILVDMLHFRVAGGRLTPDEIEARVEAAGPRSREPAPTAGDGIALLELHGIIAPRASLLAETSTGGTGLDRFMGAFRAAMADPEIGAIIIDVDSPGGQVGGLTEASTEIRAARDRKPITAVANGTAASAAYWLASQAGEVIITPSGWVGSIGVRSAHEDMSAHYEQQGIKVTEVSAGRYKTEGSPYGPLTDEARAHMQQIADSYMEMFLADVARGRRVPIETVRTGYGEGRMLLAGEARAAGMVDRVDSLDGVIRSQLARPAAQRTATLSFDGTSAHEGTFTVQSIEVLTDLPITDAGQEPEPSSEAELQRQVHLEVELSRSRVR